MSRKSGGGTFIRVVYRRFTQNTDNFIEAERHQPRHEAQIGVRFAGLDQLVGAVEPLVLFTVAGIGAGQRAQRQQPLICAVTGRQGRR